MRAWRIVDGLSEAAFEGIEVGQVGVGGVGAVGVGVDELGAPVDPGPDLLGEVNALRDGVLGGVGPGTRDGLLEQPSEPLDHRITERPVVGGGAFAAVRHGGFLQVAGMSMDAMGSTWRGGVYVFGRGVTY